MLSRIAREFAAEIASHDWSDAPYRLDRAGHRREDDSPARRVAEPLDPTETAAVRTNVMWVTAQVLRHMDPNLDLHEYATACGVPRSITHRTNGSRSDVITYGLRWHGTDHTKPYKPGAPLWRVQVQCDVANAVVFKRLLDLVEGFDPIEPPVVESTVGSTRIVTVMVRDWDEDAAGRRAIEAIESVSAATAGGPATLVAIAEQD
ncbi:hypothetical protein [Mycolicibacterium sp. lyk4-40-TYG-92]|uniref:hypothetical protein n=1 Tax=Mycolicibacterium sp. lyk4-40-TYG-92 TaxID=3040295 RepID=UPI002550E89B|nr:hypothetical protein [Mycolicibacterium sp. lyk4-40-TYG-92]